METADPRHYALRLFLRAWLNTRATWNFHKWFPPISSAICTALVYAVRTGWALPVNIGDMLINAVGGSALAFVASLVYNLICTPKLLDDDRVAEITGRDATIKSHESKIARQSALLAKPPRSSEEEHHYRFALDALRPLSPVATSILRAIHTNGGRVYSGDDVRRLTKEFCLEGEGALSYLQGELAASKLIAPKDETVGGIRQLSWGIIPGYKSALSELLFRPATPPSA